jgi:NAD(P)-dependent dehydrogenase (short-subunit alcohol dehydrogenase family)
MSPFSERYGPWAVVAGASDGVGASVARLLGERGVMVLGPTDTPAFRKVLHGRDFDGIADPDDVARNMLDNLSDGPVWPPGGSPYGSMSRREAVELMSQGTAFLAD